MKVQGSCHCKATRFEAAFAPESVTRCNCSFCAKSGGALGLLRCGRCGADLSGGGADLSLEKQTPSRTISVGSAAVGDLQRSARLLDREPNFEKPRISLNARLIDGFDLDASVVIEIDGKNGW